MASLFWGADDLNCDLHQPHLGNVYEVGDTNEHKSVCNNSRKRMFW